MAAIVNAAQCAIEALPGGTYVVTKTSGDPSVPDASAVSDQGMVGDFVLRARALGAFFGYFGVSANPLASNAFNSIDRAVQMNGATCRCYESGLLRPPSFTLDGGYVWLRRTGSRLDYLYGPELATAAVARSVTGVLATLWFDSAIVTLGVGLEVKFGPPGDSAATRRRRRLSLALGL
jgi:hypothetical protein